MSADNGIYILKCKDQYRVLHTQAIDNIYLTFEDSSFGVAMNTPVSTRIIEYFGDYKYTRSKETALNIAYSMLMKLDVCEYGIQVISVNRTWKQIVNEANTLAEIELDYLSMGENEYQKHAYERLLMALGVVNK